MARNDSDVSLADMRTFAVHAVSLKLSMLQGKSRPLIQCLNQLFKAYEGTSYAKAVQDCLDIRMDMARVITSQSVKNDRRYEMIESLERILTAINDDPAFNRGLGQLSKEEKSLLSDACDLYTRLGMMQFRNVCDYLGVFNHDKPSDILLENSVVCTDRQTTTPGIYNDILPYPFFAAYVAGKHVRAYEILKKLDERDSDEGPAL